MADSAVAITAGTGTSIDTRTEGTNGHHRQVVVIGDPATNAGVAPVDSTNGLAVDVKQSALPSGAATAANQTTIIGHVDGIETVLGTIDTDTGNIATAASAIQTAVETLDDAISGTEMRVDIVAALPSGTNAIGTLLPPDIDVTTHTNYAKKYYTNAGAVTDGIIWSPAAGKRWHATFIYINVSADATVTLEDDKAGGDEVVWKGELAGKSGFAVPIGEKYPLASGEDAADLIITTTAGNVYVTCVGYEV